MTEGESNGAPLRPSTYILDIYGSFMHRGLGRWVAISHLIVLMGDLGIDEQSVRSATSRLKRRGMLETARQDGLPGYRLSDEGVRIIQEGDQRIYGAQEPADLRDGWALAIFSVPEVERRRRHLLRSRLGWLGFGNPAPGVWIAPVRLFPDAERAIERLGMDGYVHLYEASYRGFKDVRRMVAGAWDLERLDDMYRSFVTAVEPVVERWLDPRIAGDERDAFVDYIVALHQWRKFPYLDPGLPTEVLPPHWSGRRAASLFFDLVRRLEILAFRHVYRVIESPRDRAAAPGR
jgi:phenylacetic acid degradation operon negative regulatory protein